jgi:Transcription factor zinc-finger
MTHESKVELKYCERCGGLWLRREGNHAAYCATCAPEMRRVAHKKVLPAERWTGQTPTRGGVPCA